jgi:dienelactone hydrolase
MTILLALLAQADGFTLDGEKWTWKDADRSFSGILLKPAGDGPFPAVLISHGLGGSAEGFGRPKAKEMASWGLVCIAPDYTHAGRGGDRATFGASEENLKRAQICLDQLAKLPYVDKARLAAYGNSMGGFLTIGLAAREPERLKAAMITAGGVAPRDGAPAPSEATASKIKVPFLILHGSTDTTVRPEQSARLKELLDAAKTPNERHVWDGVGHALHQQKADEVYTKLRDWLRAHQVLAK